jgi:DNA-directed RNA polymerase subunit F
MKHTTTEARRLQPLLSDQRSAWRFLNSFAETPKDECAFRAKFLSIAPEDRAFLRMFYSLTTGRDLFKRICRFWNVPTSRDGDLEEN